MNVNSLFKIVSIDPVDIALVDPAPTGFNIRPVDRRRVEDFTKTLPMHQSPILVREGPNGRLLLVDGQHRLEAAKTLGWTKISAMRFEGSEEAALIVGLVSNVKRKNLSGLEFARAVAAFDLHVGGAEHVSSSELGEAFGVDPTKIKRAVMTKLIPEVKATLASGKIGEGTAYELTMQSPAAKAGKRDDVRTEGQRRRGVGKPQTSPTAVVAPAAHVPEHVADVAMGSTNAGVDLVAADALHPSSREPRSRAHHRPRRSIASRSGASSTSCTSPWPRASRGSARTAGVTCVLPPRRW